MATDEDLPAPEPEGRETRSLATPAPSPEQVGPYKVLDKLGEGGMGVVYLAEQPKPIRRRVALKLIKAGMDTDQVIARFESERQALALMNHPNIAKVFDAGATEQGRSYFAMEYVRGVPITRYCDTQRMTTQDRLRLFTQVCDGVQHAHQKGIIHRDIKASNVLVAIQDDQAVPKIIDFGVAKAIEQRLTDRLVYTQMGVPIGTPAYMSPEQAEMTAQDVDTRADVYSLGVLLYELLTGSLPFHPGDLRKLGFDEIRRKIREEEPSKPSTKVTTIGDEANEAARRRRTEPTALRKQLKGDLDWIVMRALEKDRTRRYPSASALGVDVDRHLKHQPVAASPPSATYRIRKFIRRHRIGVGFAAVIAVLLVGFAATMGIQARRIAVERDAARQVSDFLVGLFNVVKPGEISGREVTAEEILDLGVERLGTELQDQPLIRARLQDVVGDLYRELGLYAKARPLLEQAVTTRTELLGEEHAETADSLAHLGFLLYRMGEFENARKILERCLAIRTKVLGVEHSDVAWTLSSLASVAHDMHHPEEARRLYERALEIEERVLGPEHPSYAAILNDFSIYLRNSGDYEEARLMLERAVAIYEKQDGPDHPNVAYPLHGLANLNIELGYYEEALPLFERSLRIWEKSLGPDHDIVSYPVHNLGNLYYELGDYRRAESYLKRALEIRENTLGRDNPEVAWYLDTLGANFHESRDYDRARELFERSLELRETAFGDESPDLAWPLWGLARLQLVRGNIEAADPLFTRALELMRKAKPEQDPWIPYHEARYHAMSGNETEALEKLEKAIELGFPNLRWVAADPQLEALRDDPRFHAILAATSARSREE